MIIIDTNPEVRLLQQLEKVRTQGQDWRCINLHLSKLDPAQRQEEADRLLSRIASEDSFAYFMPEGEVFLLGRGFSIREVRKACQPINESLADIAYDPLNDYYEMHNGWGRLIFLIDDKVRMQQEQARGERLRQQKVIQEAARQAVLNTPVDPGLIESLSERRQAHRRPVVLVVEDEPFSGRLVENVLSSAHQVSLVGDGQSAILNYARLAPHVVFLDIDLPDISGHDVLYRIKSMDPTAYIVMLSGNADRDHISRAVQKGAAGFVGKPFTRDKLGQYIDRCPLLNSLKTGDKP